MPFKKGNLSQYRTFLYCSPFSYRSSNFAIAKVVSLNLFASIFYEFCRFVHGFFSVLLPIQLSLFYALKVLAKSNGNLFAIAFKSDFYRYRNSWKSDNFRKRTMMEQKGMTFDHDFWYFSFSLPSFFKVIHFCSIENHKKRSKELIPKSMRKGLTLQEQ